jgi:hypothetical protein
MSSALFPSYKNLILQAGLNLSSLTIKAVLWDLDLGGAAVTGATNATPIVMTVTAHGLSNGMLVSQAGVGGNANANGLFVVQNVATNTYELTNPTTGANIAGSGAYTSGGRVVKLGLWDFYDDMNANIVGAAVALASKTFNAGVFDAADLTFTAVSGASAEALLIFNDTGTPSTSNLIAYIDSATGLPVTPNSGDINIVWSNGIGKIFQL